MMHVNNLLGLVPAFESFLIAFLSLHIYFLEKKLRASREEHIATLKQLERELSKHL